MFSRSELKYRAKQAFKKNYGLSVLVALILAFIGGSLVTSSGNSVVRDRVFDSSPSIPSFSSKEDEKIYKEIFGKDSEIISEGRFIPEESRSFFSDIPGVSFFTSAFTALVAIILFIALIIGIFLNALVFNPLKVGCTRFFILNADSYPSLKELGFAFKTNYWNVVKVMFITDVYILLWSLLFIIPGIIKGYSYHLVPYLLAENPDMTAKEAIDLSREIMDGYKFSTFILDLSFIGWNLLELITFGLSGVLYSNPYYYATHSELYLYLTPNATSRAY